MTRVWALVLCGLMAVHTAAAAPVDPVICPISDPFVIARDQLPRTAAAVSAGKLSILALGGAATVGGPAHGNEYTYPARLAARLNHALPAVKTEVVVMAAARQPDNGFETKLAAYLAERKPALVIWGPGATSAAVNGDLDTFSTSVSSTIGTIHAGGADLILMSLQYAPSVSRLLNLAPYRATVMLSANETGVPVFDRYDLMRLWSDTGFIDLDATDPGERVRVARKLYDCMAQILSNGIVDAVK